MFKSAPAKAVFVLLIIIGFLQFMAKGTVEKQAKINAITEEQARQHYEERLQERQQKNNEKAQNYAAFDAERENHHVVSKISGYLSSIKNTVYMYKRKHDKWPEDMEDLDLNSEKAADGRYIVSIKIDDGDIYAFLHQEYGANKIVSLRHVEGPEVFFPWVCATNLQLKENTTIAGAVCSQEADITFRGRYIQ